MKSRLIHYWQTLSGSLWFVPAVMTLLSLGLAIGIVRLDRAISDNAGWAYGGGPEGAREVLSAIASSMITVAGVAFSVTIVALTLASQQFGPRLLRNFMRDRGNQVVLGTFIATFTYSLVVLRTIRSGGTEFVPHLSVSFGIVMALASLGVLIYFIHHAAVSIQAPEVIAMVASDLQEGIDRLFPDTLGRPAAQGEHDLRPEVIQDFERGNETISCTVTGYLQSVDNDRLMALAADNNVVFLLLCRPGDFMIDGDALTQFKPRADEEVADKVRSCFIFGDDRTHVQDIQFTIHQLVEVAVRALSPGINDPITAINCIDRLAAALCRLAQRSMPSAYRFDAQDELRVLVARPIRFKELVDSSFDMIRQYGRSSTAVTLRLLDAIILIAERVRREEDRAALSAQAIMIDRGSRDGLLEERDRQEVKERFGRAVLALQERSHQESTTDPNPTLFV
jgi:uncharacterized membrane protein